ncbi:hypothetical protein [Longimicrobium terrae]|uniref:YVTN family beta-propeller protein n=1 Tax=Longimicrobium terrae TaxID=1639882 RepID=A0A841GYC7_9BACT|nr:hypothetical protein [Longimicrobium terrae]MBB4636356.1 YVTN family beta-propeller protein [Longimicrobium terrae]MBB6070752.1 YVTN family beta-propeller protein [Longimicrobium terrae]NNC29731.1 hypothetical protein [Longimicrobium terrae]
MRMAPLLALLALAAPAAAQSGTPRSGERMLVVANKQDATASLIDPRSGTTVATLPTGTGPHEAAVSHDGRWAVVSDYGDRTPGGTLTVIDLDSRTVARKIDLSPHRRPHGVAFLPGDRTLAVTSESSQAVLMVDFASGAVTAIPTGQAGSHMLAVSPDGATIYTANVGGGSVTRIDIATKEARTVSVAPRTEGIGLSADGAQVWVGSNDQNTVTVLDARTLAALDTLPAPGLPYRVNGGGRWMVVSNPMNSTVRVFDAASRAQVAEIRIPLDPARAVPQAQGSAGPVGGVVTADGATAYIALQGMNAVAEIDLVRHTVVRVLPTGAGPDGIALAVRR